MQLGRMLGRPVGASAAVASQPVSPSSSEGSLGSPLTPAASPAGRVPTPETDFHSFAFRCAPPSLPFITTRLVRDVRRICAQRWNGRGPRGIGPRAPLPVPFLMLLPHQHCRAPSKRWSCGWWRRRSLAGTSLHHGKRKDRDLEERARVPAYWTKRNSRRLFFHRNVDALAEQNMVALRAELALDPSFGQETEAAAFRAGGADRLALAAQPGASADATSEQTTTPMLE